MKHSRSNRPDRQPHEIDEFDVYPPVVAVPRWLSALVAIIVIAGLLTIGFAAFLELVT